MKVGSVCVTLALSYMTLMYVVYLLMNYPIKLAVKYGRHYISIHEALKEICINVGLAQGHLSILN